MRETLPAEHSILLSPSVVIVEAPVASMMVGTKPYGNQELIIKKLRVMTNLDVAFPSWYDPYTAAPARAAFCHVFIPFLPPFATPPPLPVPQLDLALLLPPPLLAST